MSDNARSFRTAQMHRKLKKEYREALARARSKAILMAEKLLDIGLDKNGAINGDTIDAMKEVLRDARENLAKKDDKKRRIPTGVGIPKDTLEDAIKTLEED